MKISIIGLGATGTSFLHSFFKAVQSYGVDTRKNKIEIDIFEKNKDLFTGLAYSTISKSMILNMRAETMSIDPEDNFHFIKWMTHNLSPSQVSIYPSRDVFGEYLKYYGNALLENAKKRHITIRIHENEVVNCQEARDKITITSKDGGQTICDYALLSIGNIQSEGDKKFIGKSGYLNSSYVKELLEINFKNVKNIFVLGSSLTAVDFAAHFFDNDFAGKLYFFSRHGYLPGVQRGIGQNYDMKFVNRENLINLTDNFRKKITIKAIAFLFKKEFENALGTMNWQEILNTDGWHYYQKLDDESATTVQSILNATTNLIGDFWNSLQKNEQKIFMNNHYALWCSYRHCMPQINAKKIQKLIENNQLEIKKASADMIQYNNDKFQYITNERTILSAEYLINAIGTEYSCYDIKSNLVQNMLMHTLQPHRCGGVDVDFSRLSLKGKNSKSSHRFFCVGSLTRGVHFYTNAMLMNARHAHTVANLITQNAFTKK